MQNSIIPPDVSRGISANQLKVIAIVAMFIDHAAYLLPADYYAMPTLAMHMIGRTTAPIMFYLLVEGYHHTRNASRYTLRLGIFALVSWFPFVWFASGELPNFTNWMNLNVIYTLFIGLLALRALHEVKNIALRYLAIALCFTLSIWGDWDYMAILYILAFDVLRGDFKKQAFGYTVIVLTELLVKFSELVNAIGDGISLQSLSLYIGMIMLYLSYFIPLLLLKLYNGTRGRGGAVAKWGFYVFYPAHLLLLCVIREVTNVQL